MNRPEQRMIVSLSQEEREELAAKAEYTGSPEHKVERYWGGLPEARQLKGGRTGRPDKEVTTECHLTSLRDRVRATYWVREAIRAGQYKYFEGNRTGFPNRVWYQADGTIWVGYCINRASGEYKGWPIDEHERDKIFGRVD